MAATLALALCPALAFAEPLQAADAKASVVSSANHTLKPQTQTTVYVPVSSKQTVKYSEGGSFVLSNTKYSYTAAGLIEKVAVQPHNAGGSEGKRITKWFYSGKNITKISTASATVKVTCKDGKIMKTVRAYKGSDAKMTGTYTYDKAGRLTKVKQVDTWNSDGKAMSEKSTTSIACNKWGMPTKTTTNYGSSKSTIKYAYDKKGGITKTTYSTGTTRYKNSYKNGNLVKRTQLQRYDGDSEYVTSYTYKRLRVDKSYAPLIKAQVAALQNMNVNYALGDGMLSLD